jgi:hypothetical protein
MGDRPRGTGSELSLHPSGCLTGQISSGPQWVPRGYDEMPQNPRANNRRVKISNTGAGLPWPLQVFGGVPLGEGACGWHAKCNKSWQSGLSKSGHSVKRNQQLTGT